MAMIESLDEYAKLAQLADVAEEALGSMRFGSHFALNLELRKYGANTRTREGDIKAARRICDEFMMAYQIGAIA